MKLYRKIDLFYSDPTATSRGERPTYKYVATTQQSRTLKEAKEKFYRAAFRGNASTPGNVYSSIHAAWGEPARKKNPAARKSINRKSQITRRAPSARLKARRAKRTRKGYWPNPKISMRKTTHKGTYYFANHAGAQLFAQKHGYPTDRIIQYERGWAIQGGVSGDYAGPHGLKIGDWPNAVLKRNPIEVREMTHAEVLALAQAGNVAAQRENVRRERLHARGLPSPSEARAFLAKQHHTRAVRQNPARATRKGFILVARNHKSGKDFYYDGSRFGDKLKPKFFYSFAEVNRTAQLIMLARYKSLAGYELRAVAGDSEGGRKQNPSPREGLDAAAQRLERFSGHKATSVMRVQEKDVKTGLVVGKLDGVLYSTVRDGNAEKYIHRFRNKSRPLLAASSDGTQLRIVGGQFEFTEAGIEDR